MPLTARDFDGTNLSAEHIGENAQSEILQAANAADGNAAAFAALRSGSATIALGQATVVVALGLAFDGKPAIAQVCQAAADATLLRVERTSWDGSGNLTIRGTANATAAVAVKWWVDGR